MTRIILLTIISFCNYACLAQKMKIENRNWHVRAGVQNAIGFSLDRKFDSLYLNTSQGTFEREGNVILIIPASSGQDTLFAKFFHKGKLIDIDTAILEVIKPEVFPTYGAEILKKVSIPLVKEFGGILFNIRVTDDHWEGVHIESYRFSVIRRDSVVFSMLQYSNKYSPDLQAKLDLLIAGDKILISDIVIGQPFSKFASCLPGVFEIE